MAASDIWGQLKANVCKLINVMSKLKDLMESERRKQ